MRAHDREPFWLDLTRRYSPRLRAYCRVLRCDAHEVDDIVWDVWAAAVEVEERLRYCDDPWAILQLILRHECAWRVRRWRREVPQAVEIAVSPVSVDSDSTAVRLWVDTALSKLPPHQRTAIDFRYRWGMPYSVIAAALEIAEPTVRVHVTRGMRRLRQLAADSRPPRADPEADK